MAVRTRVIDGPVGPAVGPVRGEAEAPSAANRGIHETGKGPLRLFLPIRGQRELFVFNAGVFAERALESIGDAEQAEYNDTREDRAQDLPQPHWRRHSKLSIALQQILAALEAEGSGPVRFMHNKTNHAQPF